MNNEVLIKNVKEWMTVDNRIKELQKQTKELRALKKELTGSLVNIMKTNEIDCFDVQNGKLLYTRNKVKSSLSKKHLLSSLSTYFKGNDKMVQEIAQHVLDSREVKIKENIKRK